jgi:AcrR family transcriptional regulator
MLSENALSKRTRQKLTTRAALLAAARSSLAEGGLAACTTRKVCARAGVAHGTFFVHFPDVAALIEELLDEHIARALELAESRARSGGVVKRLLATVATLIKSYAEAPELARAALSTTIFIVGRERPTMTSLAVFRQRWLSELEAAKAHGEILVDDPGSAFDAIFATYFGVLVASLRGDLTPAGAVETVALVLRSLITEVTL